MATVSYVIPLTDIEEARRKGYRYVRAVGTFSEGTITGECTQTRKAIAPVGVRQMDIHQRTQVRTGFNPATGAEIWEDLETAKEIRS